MFHFDVTCEDTRLIARESLEQGKMRVLLCDNHSGTTFELTATFCEVEKMISGMICCHGDVPAESYPELEELLKNCPPECRPIP